MSILVLFPSLSPSLFLSFFRFQWCTFTHTDLGKKNGKQVPLFFFSFSEIKGDTDLSILSLTELTTSMLLNRRRFPKKVLMMRGRAEEIVSIVRFQSDGLHAQVSLSTIQGRWTLNQLFLLQGVCCKETHFWKVRQKIFSRGPHFTRLRQWSILLVCRRKKKKECFHPRISSKHGCHENSKEK